MNISSYTPSGDTLTRFHLDKSFVRVLLGPLGCLSGETEFLTPAGWRRIDEYHPGDLVGEWSEETGRLRFKEPIRYIDEACDEMWHFSNCHSLSMLVSDEHRIPLWDWSGKFCVRTAANLAAKPLQYKVPINFLPAAEEGIPLSDAELRLAVAVAADGCEQGKKIVICVRKERKKVRIRQLLIACGRGWCESTNSKRPTEVNFYFDANGLRKGFDASWWGANSHQLDLILEECLLWDGLAGHEENRFFTNKRSEAGFIQFAAHATGRRASVKTKKDVRNAEWADIITVQFSNPGSAKGCVRIGGGTTKIERVPAPNGRKYCFETFTGFFVVRHNGCVFITGNSAKTTACCWEIMIKALAQAPDEQRRRRTRWLVCRNTIPELETTTLPSWRSWFHTDFGMWRNVSPITHSWRFNTGDGTEVEADILFLGLDGPDAANKIRGMELTGAWLNEAKDISKGVLDMLTLRVGRYPPKKWGGPTWHGIIADTNMPDDDHWLYDLAEVQKPDGWAFFRQPGGVLKSGGKWVLNPKAENLKYLPEKYYEQTLGGKSEEWIKVFLAAEYGYVADGRPVFPEYSDIFHVADLEYNPMLPLYLGMDFGLTPAVAVGQIDSMGRKVILAELVTFNCGIVQFAETLRAWLTAKFPHGEIAAFWGDPAAAKRTQTDKQTLFQIMKAGGFDARPAPGNNEYIVRQGAVGAPLMRLVEGKPGLLIDRKCVKLRAGMAGKYCYRRIQVRGDSFADRPDKNEWSHVCEALQYLCLGWGEGRELVMAKGRPGLKQVKVISGSSLNHREISRPNVVRHKR